MDNGANELGRGQPGTRDLDAHSGNAKSVTTIAAIWFPDTSVMTCS